MASQPGRCELSQVVWPIRLLHKNVSEIYGVNCYGNDYLQPPHPAGTTTTVFHLMSPPHVYESLAE